MIKIKNSQTDFTTKYIIDAKFTIKGVVEKSDIVGAIFGQTEGLLLDLDLRDLQKSGRIGRIEVENESKEGISEGEIKIPSSLTRKETALLAATIETVSRVGPCESEIKLIEIKDVRETKRKQIIERAAELLKEWDSKSLEPSEIEEKIDKDIKLGEIISWGPERLPAGPEIDKSPENHSRIVLITPPGPGERNAEMLIAKLRSSSNLSLSRIPFSRMPGATSGWPIAPNRIASNLRSSSMALSGRVSPVLLYLSPPKSNSVNSTLKLNLSAAASSTFTASTVTSGPVPSPGITAILYTFKSPCSKKNYSCSFVI